MVGLVLLVGGVDWCCCGGAGVAGGWFGLVGGWWGWCCCGGTAAAMVGLLLLGWACGCSGAAW